MTLKIFEMNNHTNIELGCLNGCMKWILGDQVAEIHNSFKLHDSFFIYKKLFYKNVEPENCQNMKDMLREYPRRRGEQFIFTAFTFLNPENLNNIMSYTESEFM